MIRIFRIVLFLVCVFGVIPAMYAEKTVEKSTVSTANFDWEPVMQAIIQVESEGNAKAVKGNSCGAMQITLMQSEFNPGNNVEKAIRAWNGGNNYNKKRTQRYFEKVMKELKKQ